jgi:hypothetical protein
VAPSRRLSRSRTLAVLLPSRAPAAFADVAFLGALEAFLAGLVFLRDLGLDGATRGLRGAALGLVAALGSCAAPEVAMACSSGSCHCKFSFAVITAVTTWITRVRR